MHRVLTILIAPTLSILMPDASRSEGGCPNGLYPVGGGYCRNITCPKATQFVGNHTYIDVAKRDETADTMLSKYGKSCPYGYVPNWGDLMVPKR